MNMLAYIKETRAPGLTLVTKEVPSELRPNEVLIKVHAVSICGTDVHIYKWDKWAQGRINPPLTVGHEFSGKVIQVGSAVTRVKVGDTVSAETHIVCNHCEYCLRGDYHICENTLIIGVDTDGCYAEYVRMPEQNLIVDHSDTEPRYLSVLEPLGNAVHTIMHFDVKNKIVAIVGCGPIGLMAINVAQAAGAKKIIAIEVNDYRIALAKSLGVDVVVNPAKEDVIHRIKEETSGKGVDIVAEFSGNKLAIEQAFKYVKPGGKMSLLGISSSSIEIDISTDVVFKGITIYGVVGRRLFETWDQVTQLIHKKAIQFDKIVTHFYRFDQLNEAMATMSSGNSGKVVILVEEES